MELKKEKPTYKVETVEEYLARGGKINKVIFGSKLDWKVRFGHMKKWSVKPPPIGFFKTEINEGENK